MKMLASLKVTGKQVYKSVVSGAGLVGLLIVLWKPFYWAVGFVSNVDFVQQHKDAIWAFLDSGAGTLVSIVIGALIIGISIHRRPQDAGPSKKTNITEARQEVDSKGAAIDRWLTPKEAISAFVPRDVRQPFEEASQRRSSLVVEIMKLYDESRRLKTDSGEAAALSKRLQTVQTQEQEAKEEQLRACGAALQNLKNQLADQKLLARGFSYPANRPDSSPILIDSAQWQFLTFDLNEEKLNKAGGGGVTWIGVQIGAPKQKSAPASTESKPTYVAEITIVAGLTPQADHPVLLIGTAGRTEPRLRIVLEHSHYFIGTGWRGWVKRRQVELADIRDVIEGQQVMVPIVTCSTPSGELAWGKINQAPGNAIRKGKKYRARVRLIGSNGQEQHPIYFLLVRTTADASPYLMSVTTQDEFDFIHSWDATGA
jgi:hypothetical protein